MLAATVGRLVGCQIAHVEAGLRSFDWRHPFPEELTRIVVSRLAGIAYCPGAWACGNLKPGRVGVVNTNANTILDALRYAVTKPAPPRIRMDKSYAVVSVHRFENLQSNERMGIIIDTIEQLSKRVCVVLVLHPTTRKRLEETGEMERLASVTSIEMKPRMTYVPFMQLVSGARLVITDGGSNQEELSYLGVPTLLMRMATERQEGLGSNVVLSRFDSERIRESLAMVDRPAKISSTSELPADSPVNVIVDDLQRRLRYSREAKIRQSPTAHHEN
ncbi:UDP-N-acetylglucosamine 2-epimerase [Guyparkeria sp. SB14A]|uniref:UDP-N-acetylglucosamine 2-epimerase n=1 Tax=Guyparkeria sp. SB14A TaxID=2571147 RepID=UPI001FFDB7E4|nr:UDP-N-acetylglucosamine 2-epimerase [Guyparkeria sp. SB14A]